MDDGNQPSARKAFPSISPYLLRPLRSREQAAADIAAAKKSGTTVTTLVPLALLKNTRTTRNIAA